MIWLQEQHVRDLFISVVTVLELERGVRQKERSDPKGARALRQWLDEDVRATFTDQILPIHERIAITAARLHVPDPWPEMDALIAATAEVHDLTLVTHNTKDFPLETLRLLDPWES